MQGFKGRTGIYELVMVDDAMRTMIHDGASEQELERTRARMTPSIRDDGRAKILAGTTTIEEVLRVTREDLKSLAHVARPPLRVVERIRIHRRRCDRPRTQRRARRRHRARGPPDAARPEPAAGRGQRGARRPRADASASSSRCVAASPPQTSRC